MRVILLLEVSPHRHYVWSLYWLGWFNRDA
jgi:hypothetical protein